MENNLFLPHGWHHPLGLGVIPIHAITPSLTWILIEKLNYLSSLQSSSHPDKLFLELVIYRPTFSVRKHVVLYATSWLLLYANSTPTKFIDLLASRLQIAGCTVLNAMADADLLNVQTSVASERTKRTALAGEDTYFLSYSATMLILMHTICPLCRNQKQKDQQSLPPPTSSVVAYQGKS